MQGISVADAPVGATIKIALEKVTSFAADPVVMVWGFKKDLERLSETLGMISDFVDDAEEKQVKVRAVNRWLKKLEELACRAEHVLDEVNYEMLRRTVEDENQLRSKVCFFTSHNTIVFRLRMARKIKDINTRFKLISEEATALGLQFRVGNVANTTLLPTNIEVSLNREKDSVVPNVVGRDNDAAGIVEKLLSTSAEPLSFITITGMGGLGKTTLAQLVYNQKEIVHHFGKRIWVSVSEDFEPKRIFKLILESLDGSAAEGRDTIVQRIKEKLGGKSYLLVLDDVWNEDSHLWDEFLGSLKGISSTFGSWIIVTTRKLQVASILGAGCAFSFEKLPDEDCLHIVKEKALLQGDRIQGFEAIKEKIRELCQGLPLAATVIGGLLCKNPTEQRHSVLQKGISNTSTGDEYSRVMQILKLSFDHLPSPSLKQCFAYCSLFEKDSVMEKKQLIELWTAEGLLQQQHANEMELGSLYINSLVQSSLLQEVINGDGKSEGVRMHDLVHDLARSISQPKTDVRDINCHDRSLVIYSFGEETKTLPKLRILRTLFLGSGIPNDMLISFKHLHALKLSVRE